MNLNLTMTPDLIIYIIGLVLFCFLVAWLQTLPKRLKKKPSKPQKQKSQEKKVKSFNKIYGKITMAKVDEMTGEEFEILIEKLIRVVYQDQVVKTEFTTRTGDQGCDLIIHRKDGTLMGIQCKRYKNNVGNAPVKEIVNSKPFYGLNQFMVVTNSNFTPGGLEAIKKHKVTMVDRKELQIWIDIYNQRLEKLHSKK